MNKKPKILDFFLCLSVSVLHISLRWTWRCWKHVTSLNCARWLLTAVRKMPISMPMLWPIPNAGQVMANSRNWTRKVYLYVTEMMLHLWPACRMERTEVPPPLIFALLIDDYDIVFAYRIEPTPQSRIFSGQLDGAISPVLCIIVSGKSENG